MALRAKTGFFSITGPLLQPNIGFIGIWKAVYRLKPAGQEGCVGLRRENFRFPEFKKLKPSFLWFWIQISQCWTKLVVTHFLQDQEAELSIPADLGRVFHPVWRPQYMFLWEKRSFFLSFCVPARGRPPFPIHFWTLQYRKVSFLANGESLYPHLWCGWSTICWG